MHRGSVLLRQERELFVERLERLVLFEKLTREDRHALDSILRDYEAEVRNRLVRDGGH
jgi:hypothetical protein